MADVINFGYIEETDPNKDYSLSMLPDDFLNIFKCIKVSDDVFNEFIPIILNIPTYYRKLDNPNFGIDHFGVTLVPPESLPELMRIIEGNKHIIKNNKHIIYEEGLSELCELLGYIGAVYKSNKYMIVFGI